MYDILIKFNKPLKPCEAKRINDIVDDFVVDEDSTSFSYIGYFDPDEIVKYLKRKGQIKEAFIEDCEYGVSEYFREEIKEWDSCEKEYVYNICSGDLIKELEIRGYKVIKERK